MDTNKSGALFITCLFVLSGLSGIVYEVIWVRYFGLVFGNTVFASSTVLAVFMTGLALGSRLFGTYIDRSKNPLRVYMLLEIGIGISGLLVPLCIASASPLYGFIYRHFAPSFYSLSLIRCIISFLILIVPCTLMGATLPVLSVFVAGAFGGKAEQRAGMLYAANTAGAVLGCFIAGYFLIGTIGLAATTIAAACCNFTVAAVVAWYAARGGISRRGLQKDRREEDLPSSECNSLYSPCQVNTVVVLYAVSGFLSLFLEVAWTRAIVWVTGMDAYAFASMLSVFLSGLAIGSWLTSRFMKKTDAALLKLAAIQLCIGISVTVSAVAIQNMYGIRLDLGNVLHVNTFWGVSAFFAAQSAAIMAVPALFMGMAFPLALAVCLGNNAPVGRSVGTVYAANTAGSVAGALLAGFVAIPLIGVMKSVVIAGGLFFLIAALLFSAAGTCRKAAYNAAAIIAAAAGFAFMAFYSPSLQEAIEKGLGEGETMIYFRETVAGAVEVTQSSEPKQGKALKIDGLQVASDGQYDLASHKYPAHLVSLLKDRPKRALFIAFGAGGTAGSILRYNELERLDAVEVCGGVVEPARRYFTGMNYGVLDDPRLNLIIQDGKNFVRLTKDTYDIIYSGPIHPQSNQGSAALYTRDFFSDCRKRLAPGGIQCVWLPLHMPPHDYKLIVKTFLEVYPHAALWLTTNTMAAIAHTHFVGSVRPVTVDVRRVNEQLRKNAVTFDISLMDYITLSKDFEFIGQYAMDERKLREFTAGINASNTDNLPSAEFFRKPCGGEMRTKAENQALLLTDILRYKECAFRHAVNVPDTEKAALEKNLAGYCKGDSLRIQGHIYFSLSSSIMEEKKTGTDYEKKAYRYYTKAYACYENAFRGYFPDDRFLREFFGK